jgi:hypothetical protein
MPRVLVIGLDPSLIPGFDPAPVLDAIARGKASFDAEGIAVTYCLVPLDDRAWAMIRDSLQGDYEVVVIGGGLRKEDDTLEMFERVMNLVHEHAPRAKLAFNRTPMDCIDAAKRWLS